MTSQVKKHVGRRSKLDPQGHGAAAPRCDRLAHDRKTASLWGAAPSLAPGSSYDAGGPGAGGEQLDPPPVVPRNRARAAEPGYDPAPGRASPGSVARSEHAAAGGGVRARVRRTLARRARIRQARDRQNSPGAQTLSRVRPRPALESRSVQQRAAATLRGLRPGAVAQADQRGSAGFASAWIGAANRQLRRVARAYDHGAAPADGNAARSCHSGPAGGGHELSGPFGRRGAHRLGRSTALCDALADRTPACRFCRRSHKASRSVIPTSGRAPFHCSRRP